MGWSVSIEKDQYTNQKPICYYSMRRLLLAINKKTDPKSSLNMHKDPKLYPKIQMHSRRRRKKNHGIRLTKQSSSIVKMYFFLETK